MPEVTIRFPAGLGDPGTRASIQKWLNERH
jgi:hypothetical protein